MRKISTILTLIFLWNTVYSSTIEIIPDTSLFEITEDFYGIQYNKYVFSSAEALVKMDPLQIKWIRMWAYPRKFHPNKNQWDWQELDEKINHVDSLGYKIILCLFQGEDWDIDSTESCWWDVEEAHVEWKAAAYELAKRYGEKVDMFLLFDELHYLDTNSKYYISFKKSAAIYVEAAQEIRRANSNVPIGGPAGSLGWENGHWGNYVMKEPGGKELLDYIAANVFLIWSPYETDETIMERTIWYEETAQKIKSMMGDDCPETLVLGAYNVNGLWQLNGEIWTDPRNTNYLGGIYHALAKLHAAKGNWDITLHWDLLGGYGIFQWFPDYNENPNYFVWKFLNDFAELIAGSHLIECKSSEKPMDSVLHHSGMNVNAYGLQPFAVKNEKGEINLILINKTTEYDTANIIITEPSQHCVIYQLNENNFDKEHQPIAMHNINNNLEEVECPPMSITVVQLRQGIVSDIDDKIVEKSYNLVQNYPNPFNSSTVIKYQIADSDRVNVSIYNENGKLVKTLVNRYQQKGIYSVNWTPVKQSSGVYFCKLKSNKINKTIKLLYLK